MRPEVLRGLRAEAWATGRTVRDSLIAEFERTYREPAPPPAIIVDELIRDFLNARLHFDPLPLDRYAETGWEDGEAVVVVNSLTALIPGVKDAAGVQNVAKWHESMHVVRDLHVVRSGDQATFPGMLPAPSIRCPRDLTRTRDDGTFIREFFAEEAGRAAAVCYRSLVRSEAFRRFTDAARLTNAEAWELLYAAARGIGVNTSALVKQLQHEGYVMLTRDAGRNVIHRQSLLAGLLESA